MTSRCHDLMIINQLVTSFIYLSIYVFVTEIKVLILLWLDTWWVCVCVSHSVMFNSFWPHGLWPASLLCPWNSPGKNTGVDSHSLLQGIFQTQGSNPGLPYCRQILYCLSHREAHVRINWPFFASLVLQWTSCWSQLLWIRGRLLGFTVTPGDQGLYDDSHLREGGFWGSGRENKVLSVFQAGNQGTRGLASCVTWHQPKVTLFPLTLLGS